MSSPIAYLKGEFIPAEQAALPVYDLGLVLGATFTEMTRTFGHELFRAQDHVARLFASLKYGGINLGLTPGELLELTHEVVTHNTQFLRPNEDLAVVQFVTPGENLMYAGTGGAMNLQPTLCIHTFPLPFVKWRGLFLEGAHCITPATRHIPPQCIDPRTKHRSRLHWWLAERQAQKADPHALSLLLDVNGNITECAGANFLIVKGRTVFSPHSHSILGGISLQTVRELCAELGLGWEEKQLLIYDILNADEAWLTSTTYCMAPCTRLNGMPIGPGRPGPVFEEVLAAWSKRVGVDIRTQVLG